MSRESPCHLQTVVEMTEMISSSTSLRFRSPRSSMTRSARRSPMSRTRTRRRATARQEGMLCRTSQMKDPMPARNRAIPSRNPETTFPKRIPQRMPPTVVREAPSPNLKKVSAHSQRNSSSQPTAHPRMMKSLVLECPRIRPRHLLKTTRGSEKDRTATQQARSMTR